MKFLNNEFEGKSAYEGDFFNNRKAYGEALEKFINKVEDGCVMCLDAKWGEGKTTFVHWWKESLKKNGHYPVYFDAFKYDYNIEPFLAIANVLYKELTNDLRSKLDITAKEKKEIGTLLKKILPSIAALTCIIGATAALPPAGTLVGLGLLIKSGADAINATVKSYLKKNKDKSLEDIVEDFKTKLDEITNVLYLKNGKRLIFVIDELDRCRPSFAIEVIEKIKHCFSVRGIIWVLVMNKGQLETSIKHVYGTDDTGVYLNKFIHVTTTLPKTNIGNDNMDNNHYQTLVDKLFNVNKYNNINDLNYCVQFAQLENLAIRETQKTLFYSKMCLDQKQYFNDIVIILTICLSLLKTKYPYQYEKVRSKSITIEELKKMPMFINNIKDNNLVLMPLLTDIFKFALCLTHDDFYSKFMAYKADRGDSLLIRLINEMDRDLPLYKCITAICEKIDLISLEAPSKYT